MSTTGEIPPSRLPEEGVASQHEQSRIKGVAREIADTFSCPPSEVEQILRREMIHPEQRARIREFVPLQAIKRVKDVLTQNRRGVPRREQRDRDQTSLDFSA